MSSSNSRPTLPSPSAVSTLITNSGAKSASESLAISIVHNLQYQHNWTDLKLHLVYLNHSHYATQGSRLGAGLVDLDGLNFNHSNSSTRTASPSRSGSSSGSTTPTLNGISATNGVGTSTPPTHWETIPLISGLPQHHSYVHPDLQTYLIKNNIKDTDLPIQREFVLPLALGEKWTLRRFCGVFDHFPKREPVRVQRPASEASSQRQGQGGRRGEETTANGNAARSVSANGPATANGQPTAGDSFYEHKDQKRVLLGMRAHDGMGGDGTVVYYIMQEGEVKPRQNG